MKKIISILILIITVNLIFASCKKDNVTKNNTNINGLIQKLEAIGSRYEGKGETHKFTPIPLDSGHVTKKNQPDAGRACVADFVGAAEGACFGPFAAVASACGASLYDLYLQGAFDNKNNGGGNDNGDETNSCENPSNEHESIGIIHNKIVSKYMTVYSTLNLNNPNNMDTLKQFIVNQIESEMDTTLDVETVFNYSIAERYNTLFLNYKVTRVLL